MICGTPGGLAPMLSQLHRTAGSVPDRMRKERDRCGARVAVEEDLSEQPIMEQLFGNGSGLLRYDSGTTEAGSCRRVISLLWAPANMNVATNSCRHGSDGKPGGVSAGYPTPRDLRSAYTVVKGSRDSGARLSHTEQHLNRTCCRQS